MKKIAKLSSNILNGIYDSPNKIVFLIINMTIGCKENFQNFSFLRHFSKLEKLLSSSVSLILVANFAVTKIFLQFHSFHIIMELPLGIFDSSSDSVMTLSGRFRF